jgi:hypothetical protein
MICVESQGRPDYTKSEETRANNTTDRPITIEEREIKQATDFCHLGSTVSENGGATLDVSRRIQKAREGLLPNCKKSGSPPV